MCVGTSVCWSVADAYCMWICLHCIHAQTRISLNMIFTVPYLQVVHGVNIVCCISFSNEK